MEEKKKFFFIYTFQKTIPNFSNLFIIYYQVTVVNFISFFYDYQKSD